MKEHRMKEHRMKSSLNFKTTLFIFIISVALIGSGIYISYRTYSNTMDDHYRRLTQNIGNTTTRLLDGDQIKTYCDTLQKDEQYDEILNLLFDIQNNNDVKYLYVEALDMDKKVVRYIMDADTPEDAYQLGDEVPMNDAFQSYTNDGTYKNGTQPEINYTDTYGWLCSVYCPITDSNGEFVAYVGVDISMNDVMQDRYDFLKTLGIVMGLVTIGGIILSTILMRRVLIKPLLQIADATAAFVEDKDEVKHTDSRISGLKIKTNDEIEILADSIKKMEEDINQYIEHLQKVTAEKERIGAELNVAKNIQASMLPCIFPPFPNRSEFDIYATMNPAKEVGGDFYDFFLVDNRHLAVVIADVSGKGVPAALFMVIAKTLIKNHAQMGKEPAEVFTCANVQLCENNEQGMFVTAFMGVLDLDTYMFTFVNAGHNRPLIRRDHGDFEWLETKPGFVLAGMNTIKYHQDQIQLAPGDVFYTYTDGVTEAQNQEKELYSDPRLLAMANDTKDMSVADMIHYIRSDVNCFVGEAEQFDDITMLAFKVTE